MRRECCTQRRAKRESRNHRVLLRGLCHHLAVQERRPQHQNLLEGDPPVVSVSTHCRRPWVCAALPTSWTNGARSVAGPVPALRATASSPGSQCPQGTRHLLSPQRRKRRPRDQRPKVPRSVGAACDVDGGLGAQAKFTPRGKRCQRSPASSIEGAGQWCQSSTSPRAGSSCSGPAAHSSPNARLPVM